ncbi:MAG: hypothetical protein WA966_11930 [Ornithinimicrobium sp.]
MADRSPPLGYVSPSRTDPVVRMASNVIGGPLGRHAVVGTRGLAGVAAAVILMGAAVLSLGVFQKGHCVVKGWVDPDQFWRACYSDVTVVNVSSALANRSLPYTGESPSDQPLGAGLVMWALAMVSPYSGGDRTAQQWIFGLWALVAMVLVASAVVAIVALQPGRPWRSAHLAVSPVIAILALISVDLCAVVLVIWALWAWHRAHPVWSGLLLGMAFLFRPYPLVFLLAIVLVAQRHDQTHRALQAGVAAVASAVGLYLPFLVVLGEPMLLAPRRWLSSAPGYGGTSLVPGLHGWTVSVTAATSVALAGWAVATVTGWWLVRRGPSRHDTAYIVALAAPMMLIVVLTAKTVSVQTGLWMLPFLAMSALPWRDHLIWAGVEIVHFEAVWLYIGFGSDPGRGLPGDAYSLTVLARALAWSWVLLRVWSTRDDTAPQQALEEQDREPVRAG